MSRVKHILGFSGGIDSQAAAGRLLELEGAANVIMCNSDAGGNEHPLTIEHVAWYSANVHPIIRTNAIIADMWKTPGAAEVRGWDGAAALDFGTMIRIKGRAPSRKAQFCTEKLKILPQLRWIEAAFGPGGEFEGWDYIRYTGVRRDESDGRKNTPDTEYDALFDCELRHIIADWPKQRCFDFVKARGELVNALYSLGFGRVGCAPCINSNKDDIQNWATRFPEMIDKVRAWEAASGRTFFAPMVPGLKTNNVDQVVAWSKTKHGGRADLFPVLLEREACESKYGLCE